MTLSGLLRLPWVMRFRIVIAKFRRRYDPYYHWRLRRQRALELQLNLPYERGDVGLFYPEVLGIEETLCYIIEKKCSVSRFGDGEFALIDNRQMLFEQANSRLGQRLSEILARPIPQCLTCVLNVCGSLERYEEGDRIFWRQVLPWLRPVMERTLKSYTQPLGDPQISRPYMTMVDKGMAMRVFDLWKVLFCGKRLLIVEGRFSRLGIGNDLLSGATSIRRIWGPPKDAFAHYDEILSAVRSTVEPGEMIVLAMGATATVLAYDLAKLGYWAIDVGHVDVEYMWMKMGTTHKVVIPGRYVSEVVGGQECAVASDEEKKYNVVRTVGL